MTCVFFRYHLSSWLDPVCVITQLEGEGEPRAVWFGCTKSVFWDEDGGMVVVKP